MKNKTQQVYVFCSEKGRDVKILTFPDPIPSEERKNNLDFYFHTSLRLLKRFYESHKGFHKTF